MDCEQFGEIVHDLLRSEALDPSVIEDAFAHAESCSDCDALLEGTEAVTASLHSLAAVSAFEQAPASVEHSLLVALKRRRALLGRSVYRRFLAPAGISIGLAAALLLSLMLLRHPGPPVSAPQQKAAERSLAHSGQQAPSSATLTDAVAADNGNMPDSFVSLSEGFDVSSLEDATVVRVVLSRSAIESFGLPISENADNQVVADLALAEDGVPEAIRVVSW